MRAQAIRNRERVLRAARQSLAMSGVDVDVDDIALRAGVGVGTIYRNFPSKRALWLTLAMEQLAQLTTQAQMLVEGDDPNALLTLLFHVVDADDEDVALRCALVNGTLSLLAEAPVEVADFTHHVDSLLERARKAWKVRADVTVDDVFALIAAALAALQFANASCASADPRRVSKMVFDGLRRTLRPADGDG
jgi:AcrR family transcriptional regulator